MRLPYDYARCAGIEHPACARCRRREPGSEHRQVCISPPIDLATGDCWSRIPPVEGE